VVQKVILVPTDPPILIGYIRVYVFIYMYMFICNYMCIYIYIYILYIRSSGLPLVIESPGQTVESGRAGPGTDVYKKIRSARDQFFTPHSLATAVAR
jgi:hypothetical protein